VHGSGGLLVWEENNVRECSVILVNIALQPKLSNRWLWQLHVSKNHNVSSAYNYLMSRTRLHQLLTMQSETRRFLSKSVYLLGVLCVIDYLQHTI